MGMRAMLLGFGWADGWGIRSGRDDIAGHCGRLRGWWICWRRAAWSILFE